MILLLSLFVSFPVELSLVLTRNIQLHTVYCKRAVFSYSNYSVDEWFKGNQDANGDDEV